MGEEYGGEEDLIADRVVGVAVRACDDDYDVYPGREWHGETSAYDYAYRRYEADEGVLRFYHCVQCVIVLGQGQKAL